MTEIIVRYPPSPSGYLQVGNARTLLFNFLFAKKHGGKIVFRIEDTDRERSTKEFENAMIEDLAWLGLTYDQMHRQSDRASIHKEYVKRLVEEDRAYVSKEEAGKGKRAEVIRFRNPNTTITFTDLIRGEISMDTSDLGDFVIAKDFQSPLYHLAVVIDDYEMGITHVIRGEDHISNTPRQILLLEAIGAKRPQYAHLPLLLAQDRSKLSKRNGSVSLRALREQGYLPEAVFNFLALLGWNPGTQQEIFTIPELIEAFEITDINKSGAIFDTEKLKWINKEYIKKLPETDILEAIKKELADYPKLIELFMRSESACRDLLERIHTFGDIQALTKAGEFDFYLHKPQIDPEKLMWKKDPDPEHTKAHLAQVYRMSENIDTSEFLAPILKEKIWSYAEEKGRGNVLWPLRYALSGRDASPDPFVLAEALGKEETLARIQHAISVL